MKLQIKVPPMISELIALCYHSMQSAEQYAKAVADDRDCPFTVKKEFFNVAIALRNPMERIDKRIPKDTWEFFREQIKENDSLKLENIKALYVRMTPAQQEMLETVAEAILRKEFTIEQAKENA